jgi:hypothetical protein
MNPNERISVLERTLSKVQKSLAYLEAENTSRAAGGDDSSRMSRLEAMVQRIAEHLQLDMNMNEAPQGGEPLIEPVKIEQ